MLKCNTPLWGIRLALLLFVMSGSVTISAQCDPPDELPTTQCYNAPQTCLNNACYSTDNMSDQGHSGFCGPMTLVHNPQYFAFVLFTLYKLSRILLIKRHLHMLL